MKFPYPFIAEITQPDAINLNTASCSVGDDEIVRIDALVADLFMTSH